MQDGESEAPEQSANCFYICPIGEPDSATRKRSNQIYKHVVSAALVPLRYKMVRADEMDQSGVITSHIINGLLNEELVVADLTDHNPNVFYELAIRHAVRKPFIQLTADRQKLPFDIQGLRTVPVDHTDLDSVHEAKTTITGMVESIRTGTPVETPLTYTLDLQSLRQSDDSEARGIADIIDEIGSLKRMFRDGTISRSMRSPGQSPPQTIKQLRGLIEDLAHVGRLDLTDANSLANHGMEGYSGELCGSCKTAVELRRYASDQDR